MPKRVHSGQFVVSENADGSCDISARGDWTDELPALIASVRLRRLSLFSPEWDDYSGLEPVADKIIELNLVGACSVKSLGLENLAKLRSLSVREPLFPPIDWGVFQALEEAAILWGKGYKSTLFSLPKLKKLELSSYSGSSCSEISNAKSLVSLDIRQGGLKSLGGLEGTSELRTLSLAHLRYLSDISALSGMAVDGLKIVACPRIVNPRQMLPLPALRRLNLEKNRFTWPDFSWVGSMPSLREAMSTAGVENPTWNHVFQNESLRRFASGTTRGYHISDAELREWASRFDRNAYGIAWYPPRSTPSISLELTAPLRAAS